MEEDILMLTSGLHRHIRGYTAHSFAHTWTHTAYIYAGMHKHLSTRKPYSPASLQQLAARFPKLSPWTLPKVLLTWPQLGPKPHLTYTPLKQTLLPSFLSWHWSEFPASLQGFAVVSSHVEWTANSQDSPCAARLKVTIHSKILNRKVDSPQGN